MSNNSISVKQKTILAWLIPIAILLIVIIVAVVNLKNSIIDDNYFVTDGSKYVFTTEVDPSTIGDEEEDLAYKNLTVIHGVYHYSGNEITGLDIYYVYEDAIAAETAFDKFKEEADTLDSNKAVYQRGKYIVIEKDTPAYENYTTAEVRAEYERVNSEESEDDS